MVLLLIAILTQAPLAPSKMLTSADVAVSGLRLGDSLDRARQLYPDLMPLSVKGRLSEWGPRRACDLPIELLAIGVHDTTVTEVSGYSLRLGSRQFDRGDSISEVTTLLGPPVIGPKSLLWRSYTYPAFHLTVGVDPSDGLMCQGFCLSRESGQMTAKR